MTAYGVHLFFHAKLEYPLKMYHTITSYLLIKCAVLLHVLHYVLYNSLITQCFICNNVFLVCLFVWTPIYFNQEENPISVFAELWRKYDFQRPFSDRNLLNGRHISVTIRLTFIADSSAFQSPFSNSLFKRLPTIERCKIGNLCWKVFLIYFLSFVDILEIFNLWNHTYVAKFHISSINFQHINIVFNEWANACFWLSFHLSTRE